VALVHTVINFNKKQFPRVKFVWPAVGPPPLVTVLLLLAPRVLHVAKANTIPSPNKPQTRASIATKANTTTSKDKMQRTIVPIARPVPTTMWWPKMICPIAKIVAPVNILRRSRLNLPIPAPIALQARMETKKD